MSDGKRLLLPAGEKHLANGTDPGDQCCCGGGGPCDCCHSLTVTIHSNILSHTYIVDLVLDDSPGNCYYNNPPMVIDTFTETGAWRILYFGTIWTQNTVTSCPSTNPDDYTKTLVGSIPDMTLESIVCNDVP